MLDTLPNGTRQKLSPHQADAEEVDVKPHFAWQSRRNPAEL
jgi:hypothetical protein